MMFENLVIRLSLRNIAAIKVFNSVKSTSFSSQRYGWAIASVQLNCRFETQSHTVLCARRNFDQVYYFLGISLCVV